jgi:hypothetical protein
MSQSEIYINFTKIILRKDEKEEKVESQNLNKNQEKCNNEDKIILIYPLSGRIITENEYEKINNINYRNSSSENFKKSNGLKKRLSSEVLKEKNSFQNKVKDQDIYDKYTDLELDEEIKKLEKELEEEKNDDKIEKEYDYYNNLSNKWKKIAQDSIYKLLELFPQNENYEKNTIKSVLKSFQIDKKLIGYDEENECFLDE